MKTKKEIPFNAVEFQRERRKELSDLYNSDKAEFEKRLAAIRRKYKHLAAKKGRSKHKPLAKV